MRALAYSQFGSPRSVLTLAQVPTPEPGEGQALVAVTLSPIHNHDTWTVTGEYGFKPKLPAIGGSEAVGVVRAVGAGVDEKWIGKRVVASGNGTWAECFVARAGGLIEVPQAIADEAAAQLVAMPLSSVALLEWLDLDRGDWLIQNAANGAVGKLINTLARTRGIGVLNLVRRKAAADELKAQGFDIAIATEDEDWMDQARAAMDENGARAAIDSIGGKLANSMAELLGYKGTLVSFGSVTGNPLIVQSGPIIFKQLSIKGFWGARAIGEFSGAARGKMMAEAIEMATRGELPLDVDSILGLDQFAQALEAHAAPGRKGKVLLRP